jgi:hypothetical protein
MQGSNLTNLRTFKQLCGENCFKNITLGTSFWSAIAQELGCQHEKELIENPDYWGAMLQRGSQIVRIPDDQVLARELIFHFIKNCPNTLQAQRETVIEGKTFDQTYATQHLRHEEELKAIQEENKRKLQDQQAFYDAQLKERERNAEAEIKIRREEQQRRLAAQEEESKRLEAEKKAEEDRWKAEEEALKAERERLERESNELAEQAKELEIESNNAVRKEKRDAFVDELRTTFELLSTAKKANKVMVDFRPISEAYNAFCDNCLCSLGSAMAYRTSSVPYIYM